MKVACHVQYDLFKSPCNRNSMSSRNEYVPVPIGDDGVHQTGVSVLLSDIMTSVTQIPGQWLL